MGALTRETMRVERVELTPEQREERRREAEKLGIKIRRRSAAGKTEQSGK
ncbi:hypothetical protein LTV02_05825 [Nocardia yamanashiensis]|nr:hypothetical protein [Nocardia yamanashiensis]UGT42918.1 hypothetical protein LTV02_05825 [Nocardia yamanashiensis]